jgi:hypothetical protein
MAPGIKQLFLRVQGWPFFEWVIVLGLFNRSKRVNRFNNALEIEVTRPGWPAK